MPDSVSIRPPTSAVDVDSEKLIQVLAKISADFIDLPPDGFDDAVSTSLRRVAELIGADRGTFAQVDEGGVVRVSHSWNRPGVRPPRRPYDENQLPWIAAHMRRGEPVWFERRDEIPEEMPDRRIAEIEGVSAFTDGDGLLRALVLFDLRFVAGERELCDRLRERIYSSVGANLPLQHRLAELIVDSTPPLNFIGRLVVEAFGGGDEEFDLKSRGMAPLRDAARLFALRYKLNRRHSTGGRWDELRRMVPERAEVAGLAREAYDFLLRLRNLNGLRRGDSGRHLDPASLTKLERAQLANVFDVVRTLQQAVKLEFQSEAKRL